ncbi:thiolase-like protein [Xylariaceae sp. FL0662B]|nr:thiolase-like protein [Xylariaceae sp. FL0662B]
MTCQDQEIAIIGSGCRFPGNVNSPSQLWALLRDPRPVASEVPALKGYYHQNGQYHGHTNVKEAYLLAGKGANRQFDAAFFGIHAVEASVLDPQIRLLLETVYEALEAGGQTIDSLRGSDTAVYAGQMVNDYELLMYRDHDTLGKYHASGTSRTMLSSRVSYFFDWHGPCMTIDTACSSSLVALHHAVQQLRTGHSRVAVVAGSNLIYDAGTFIAETNLQMVSPDGRSRMWDADANGYARGEGIAAVVLKTRQAAEADGDHIECIIRGTALNQDGKTPGQTMPSASAQAQLIRDCYARAGLDLMNPAHRPQYFEAHGTGTPAGDPIEAEAVSSAFFLSGTSQGRECSSDSLLVGSIKSIIGHTEGTAGIAGVLKASLALQESQVPPNLLFDRLNPYIEPFYDNLRVPTSLLA